MRSTEYSRSSFPIFNFVFRNTTLKNIEILCAIVKLTLLLECSRMNERNGGQNGGQNGGKCFVSIFYKYKRTQQIKLHSMVSLYCFTFVCICLTSNCVEMLWIFEFKCAPSGEMHRPKFIIEINRLLCQ